MQPNYSLQSELRFDLCGQEIWFDSERAAFWSNRHTLIVSDLHWGKSGEILDTSELDELSRLATLIDKYEAKRVLILGDLIEHSEKLASNMSLMEEWAIWRERFASVQLVLTQGSHDRGIKKFAKEMEVDIVGDGLLEPPFEFRHAPKKTKALCSWNGHVHPMARLNSEDEEVELPCFHLSSESVSLPAFSNYARGREVVPHAGDVLILVGEGCLFACSAQNA